MGIIQFSGRCMNNVEKFFFTQSIFPFETLMSFYCMYGGIAGALKLGLANEAFASGIGEITALIFNIWYSIAGVAIFLGVGSRRREVEVFGLVSMITSLLVRAFVVGLVSGIDTRIVSLYVVNFAFILTCIVRIYTLFKYTVFVQVIDSREGTPVVGVIK